MQLDDAKKQRAQKKIVGSRKTARKRRNVTVIGQTAGGILSIIDLSIPRPSLRPIEELLWGGWRPVVRQRTSQCLSGHAPMVGGPRRKCSAGWATLLLFCLQRALAEQTRYMARIPRICRGSPQRQMGVIVPARAFSRQGLSHVVANARRCRGPPMRKGEV